MVFRQAMEFATGDQRTLTLIFEGLAIPSKKNTLAPASPRPGRKGLTYSAATKKAMVDLELAARVQWAQREPVIHPAIDWRITAPDPQDRDGMVTTLLDVFKKARIIVDDSIKFNNGHWQTYPADIGPAAAKVTLYYARATR